MIVEARTLSNLQGDLVSYNKKHNHVNNEESGEDNNISWNCGEENDEGQSFLLTQDPGLECLREVGWFRM